MKVPSRVLISVIVALSMAGIAVTIAIQDAPEFASVAVVTLPYLVGIPFIGIKGARIPLLFGTTFMLIVDTWICFEISLDLQSQFLLFASLLSSVKVITLFPTGIFVGYLVQRSGKLSAS